MKAQPELLQAWLATQNLPPLDRTYLRFAAANASEVYKTAIGGGRDWFWTQPYPAPAPWRNLLGSRLQKTLSYVDLQGSDIISKPQALRELPFQKNLTWKDGFSIVLILLLAVAMMSVWVWVGTVEIYVWVFGLYLCLLCISSGGKWCRVRALRAPLKPWQRALLYLEHNAFWRTLLCFLGGYGVAWCLFWVWPQLPFGSILIAYVVISMLDTVFNRYLDRQLVQQQQTEHYQLWLYSRDGQRMLYARANERASLALLQQWLNAQQQAYFDAHPLQRPHLPLTGRL